MIKTKIEVDLLSYDEIKQYEQDFIKFSLKDKREISSEDKRYLDELHYYLDVRFKDIFLQRIVRWRKFLDDENYDKNSKDMIRFLLEDKSDEQFYQQSLFVSKANLGELIYLYV